jgi:hypothetical protein
MHCRPMRRRAMHRRAMHRRAGWDAPANDAPASVMATVSRVDVVGADTLIVLAAGSADGVQPSWRVTFILEREVPPCPIVRVSRHETVCKWNQTFLPSRVVRLEP